MGAVREAHFTLYITGQTSSNILDAHFDADALGAALVPLFQDRPPSELPALFARIAVRFRECQGSPEAMREFMYSHLGVSFEALEGALLESQETESPQAPPPPPARIVSGDIEEDAGAMEDALENHQVQLQQQASSVVSKLQKATSGSGHHGGGRSASNHMTQQLGITAEQSARGVAGEEEIKRRLSLPGGWDGFVLVRDVRALGCGYDFEVRHGESEAKMEVKTFTTVGRIIFTSRELQEAGESRGAYYLVGVLDSAEPASHWSTFLTKDPILKLLKKGEFVVDAKLQVAAASMFGLEDIGEDNREHESEAAQITSD
jgi:hypothetical protein